MIYFVCKHKSPMTRYLSSWGGDLAWYILPISYKDLARTERYNHGVYIFSDIEKLESQEKEEYGIIADHVSKNSKYLVLNHPQKNLPRFELPK